MDQAKRGVALTIFAAAFMLMAISNFSKPFHYVPTLGFVFFGTRLSGIANDIVGPLFGLFLLIYGLGIWRMRRYALPMGYAYAAYVILNLIIYNVKHGGMPEFPLAGQLAYIAVAVGVSSGAAILLSLRRADLT
ncbi:MAG TPA: hypothetical protein VEC38_05610 [Candidatus Binataceae bacterium]|nr:hypothetical protein [Candidatus Binataceae bacterium]